MTYVDAIRRLLDTADQMRWYGGESGAWVDRRVSWILAAVRGPDNESNHLKTNFTAPIRLYILGREAYNKNGYSPNTNEMKTVALPISPKQPLQAENWHFFQHIRLALAAIEDLRLAPVDG